MKNNLTHAVTDLSPVLFGSGLIGICLVTVLGLLFVSTQLLLAVVAGGVTIAALLFSPANMFLYAVPILLAVGWRIRLGFFSVSISEFCLLVAWGAVILQRDVRHGHGNADQAPSFSRELWLIAIIAVLALPGAMFEERLQHALSTYRDFVLPLLFLAGLSKLRLTHQELLGLCRCLVLVAVLSAALGIVQYSTGQFMWFQTPDDAEFQQVKLGVIGASGILPWFPLGETMPVGLYPAVNDFALFLIIPASIAYCWALDRKYSIRMRIFWASCFLLVATAIFLSFFRSSIFCLFMICFCWHFLRRRELSFRKMWVPVVMSGAVVGATLLAGGLVWDQYGTVEGRLEMLTSARELISSRPVILLTGGFSDRFMVFSQQPQMVHNMFLYSLIRFGMLSTIGFYVLLLLCLRRAYIWIRKSQGPERDLGLLLMVALVIILFVMGQTAGLVDNVQSPLWIYFWLGVLLLLTKGESGSGELQPTAARIDRRRPAPGVATA